MDMNLLIGTLARLLRVSIIPALCLLPSPAGASPAGEAAGVGFTVDFNGDGYADLAVGAPHENIDGNDDAGAVNVLYGSASGLTAVGDQFWTQNSPDVEDSAGPGDVFGWSLATGDFNGDGFTDLAVGVHLEDAGGKEASGAVNVLYGSAAGLTADGDQFWSQDSPDVEDMAEVGDHFARELASADFNGDGFADLAVSATYEDIDGILDAGAVNVLYGSAAGLTAAGDQLWHQDSPDVEGAANPFDNFGWALAVANFGSGSQADLAVGVLGEIIDGNGGAGAVNVLYGSASGLSAASDQFWSQNSTDVEGAANPGDNFGWAMAAANLGNSGQADLAIGVPNENIDGNEDAGAVNVLYGSAAGLTAVGDQFWHQNSTDVEGAANPGDNFGYTLTAANFGVSSRADLAISVVHENINGNIDAGAVHVLYGTAGGLTAAGDQFWHQDSPNINGVAQADDEFGFALAAANFGKSAQADLAVGVPYDDIGGNADAGVVNVLYGSGNGLRAAGDQLWHQDSPDVEGVANPDDTFGWALAAGDSGVGSQAGPEGEPR